MFGLGPTELIVILVLALLVLGPSRIPEVASSLGKAIRSFRRATKELRDQIDIDDEVRRPLEDLRAALRDEPAPLPPPTHSPLHSPSPLVAPPSEPIHSTLDEPQDPLGHHDHDVHPGDRAESAAGAPGAPGSSAAAPAPEPVKPVFHPMVTSLAPPRGLSVEPIAGPSGAPIAGPPEDPHADPGLERPGTERQK